MKKFLFALTLIAGSLQAVQINQIVCPVNNVPPNGSVVCPGLGSAVGFTNLTLQMDYFLDVTSNPANPTGSMTVSVDNPLGNWDINNAVVTNLTRIVNVNGVPTAISDTDYNANYLAAFNSTVTGSSFTGTASDGNVTLVWTLYGDSTSQVPEPTTFALFGAALVGLGMFRRLR